MRRILPFIFLLLCFFSQLFSQTHDWIWNTSYQRLYDLGDRGQTKDLIQVLERGNPDEKAIAATCFGSMQDTNAIPALLTALRKSKETQVTQAIAFALGQIGKSSAESSLIAKLQSEKQYVNIREKLMEALGRCGTIAGLKEVLTCQTAAESEGQAIAIYRFGLRGIYTPETTDRIFSLLEDERSSFTSAEYAGAWLARVKGPDLAPFEGRLIALIDRYEDPMVQMQLVYALGKINSETALEKLNSTLGKPKTDIHVLVMAIRAMGRLNSEKGDAAVSALLLHPEAQVSTAAAEYFQGRDLVYGADPVKLAAKITDFRAKALFYRVGLKYLRQTSGREIELEALKSALNAEMAKKHSPYHTGMLYAAKCEIPASLPALEESMLEMARTGSAEQMIIAQYLLEAWWATQAELVKAGNADRAKLAESLIAHFGVKDIALTALCADVARNAAFSFREEIKDWSFLKKIQYELKLPRDIEAWYALNDLIAWTEGREPDPHPQPAFSHPVDWKILNGLKSHNVVAEIKTSKGDITLQLDPERAPGTVIHFIDLARKHYYDQKAFHRVVPNFVAQGGCPRGDGWGAPDYSIRSEFANDRFVRGSIGMASAGKDTEGVQWFITHCPTPHLDGRYTCFGQVINGMDIVDRLELGDAIISVRIIE